MMGEQRIAVVTGGNKGIGLGVVKVLAARGWRVFLGSRNPGAGEAAAENVQGDVELVALDVTNSQSISMAAREISGKVDHLDVLINNAAVREEGDNSVLALAPEILRTTLETNTLGPLRVTQAFVPLLKKSNSPRIINVSSGAGQLAGGLQSWSPAYSISKTALNSLTKQLAAALPGFAVNAVTPGWVRTDMGGENAPRSIDQGADGIVWLAADAAQDLTGQFLCDREIISW